MVITYLEPVVLRGCNRLVVIHVIRYQWTDNNLPNATYCIKKGNQINLSCPNLNTSTHAGFLEHSRHENHQGYFWFTYK